MTDDRDYYYNRAEAELEQAQRSDIPQAVKAHYALATAYLERAYADEEQPEPVSD
ncbi:hypothetical protein [Sphingomonas aracearum]|uniref:hypothetical protein n=1 Tax=Sphingomonas aracearum TaxID=2283317 RepID=UPI0015EFFFC6|nr:hypothetical protein [Sphingomonas aracearum]